MREFGTRGTPYPLAARQQVARDLAADYVRHVRACQRKGHCGDLPREAVERLQSPKCGGRGR